MEERQRRSFTDDYKRQAVDLVGSSGRSIGSVAKELGLRDSVLRRWVELRGAGREPTAAARRPATQATLPSADHAAEIARLQRENERLRMERDILKKSIAIFAGTRTWDSGSLKIAGPTTRWRSCAACSKSRLPAIMHGAPARRASDRRPIVISSRTSDGSIATREGVMAVRASMPSWRLKAAGRAGGASSGWCTVTAFAPSWACRRRARTTDSRHDLPIAPNLLDRNFTAAAPNRICLADITYIETDQGWLYLATVMDLYSRRIVGWAMADHLRTSLPLAALKMAISAQRPGLGLIHHSDRGVQYASADYRKMMQSAGFRVSMSRKANCYDNAPMESFFHTLKTELVHHSQYATRQEATRDIFAYIEGFYNRTRRHSAIGYISPIEMELKVA
jgi:transposase InsO family protein/transposase-like protein